MHSKDFLAQELRAIGLGAMADKAATGYYHDFLSPLTFPETQLLIDLQAEMQRRMDAQGADLTSDADVAAVQKLIDRHMNGEFDATTEESEEWIKSADGQSALRELVHK